MFGHHYFGDRAFGPRYFGPADNQPVYLLSLSTGLVSGSGHGGFLGRERHHGTGSAILSPLPQDTVLHMGFLGRDRHPAGGNAVTDPVLQRSSSQSGFLSKHRSKRSR
jgi:alpha-D-ribose 1-methylphosphonate 5-triphosphate synthase subunit PhnG